MIFAQLERSNISERIKDTMLHYAKMGRWTGGLTPLGFESTSIPYTISHGQDKNMVILSPIEDELNIVKIIYAKYMELQSLNAVSRYLTEHGLNTRKGNIFEVSYIRDVLRNPVYVSADKDLFHFFKENGTDICNEESEFDGSRAVIPYNRMDKKKDMRNPIEEWLIAISHHQGIVSGKEYIQVQNILKQNSDKKPRLGTAQYGIFAGLIKCANCGSTMRVKNGRVYNGVGEREFYYTCFLKESSKGKQCDIKNIIGHRVEPLVIERLVEYSKNENLQMDLAEANKIQRSSDMLDKQELLAKLKKEFNETESAIDVIVTTITKMDKNNTPAIERVMQKINPLDEKSKMLKNSITTLELELSSAEAKELDMLSTLQVFENMENISKIPDAATKRRIMKTIIECIEWDGKTITMNFKAGESVNFNKRMEGGDFFSDDAQTFKGGRFGFDPNKGCGLEGACFVACVQIRADHKVASQ
jgi:site-specific DNA recombinase